MSWREHVTNTAYRGPAKSSVQHRHTLLTNRLIRQHKINSLRVHSAADMGWTIEKCWFHSREWSEIFVPSTRPDQLCGASSVLLNGYWGVKRPECGDNPLHLLQRLGISGATPTLPYMPSTLVASSMKTQVLVCMFS
jgi:hypothetical protein